MPVRRFDARSWVASPFASRRLDLSQFAKERAAVAEICSRVLTDGDLARSELGRRFDGWAPAEGESFEVPPDDFAAAIGRVASADRAALEFAAARIREFHERQVAPDSTGPAVLRLVAGLGRRVGLYVPGGCGSYPSTVLMTAMPARVAGVSELVLATPPRPDGTIPDAILAAAHIAGVDRVYRIGGAQAIAALAYGTASIPRVDLIAGPGNIYVTLAKKEVFGAVGIDGIAGPTEVVVIADSKARPDFVAADLAAQLEHDPLAWGVLFTDSAPLADRVEEELTSLVRGLERAQIIREANCCVVVAESNDPTVSFADDFAPEPLLIVTEDSARGPEAARNAGAVFR